MEYLKTYVRGPTKPESGVNSSKSLTKKGLMIPCASMVNTQTES